MSSERGQAGIETLLALPVLMLVALAGAESATWAVSAVLAGNAAGAGARALARGEPVEPSARAELPGPVPTARPRDGRTWRRARGAVGALVRARRPRRRRDCSGAAVRSLRARVAAERGQALVELIACLPVIVLVVLALIQGVLVVGASGSAERALERGGSPRGWGSIRSRRPGAVSPRTLECSSRAGCSR